MILFGVINMSTLLAVQQVCKSFPGVNALTKVNFDLKPGEVHAIVGENGAGKSTLIKILAGAYQHDEGEIYIDDCKLERHSPLSACEKGIITHLSGKTRSSPDLTVLENLFIGNEKLNSLKCIDWKLYLKEANAIFFKNGHPRESLFSCGRSWNCGAAADRSDRAGRWCKNVGS